MTNFERLIRNLTIDKLADILNQNSNADDSVWIKWFNQKYCMNCESIWRLNGHGGIEECAACEASGECVLCDNKVLSDEDIIRMWLESEEGDEDNTNIVNEENVEPTNNANCFVEGDIVKISDWGKEHYPALNSDIFVGEFVVRTESYDEREFGDIYLCQSLRENGETIGVTPQCLELVRKNEE